MKSCPPPPQIFHLRSVELEKAREALRATSQQNRMRATKINPYAPTEEPTPRRARILMGCRDSAPVRLLAEVPFDHMPPGPTSGYRPMGIRGLNVAVDPKSTLDHREWPHQSVGQHDARRPWSEQQDLSQPRYSRHLRMQEQEAVRAHEVRKDKWWVGPCRWAL